MSAALAAAAAASVGAETGLTSVAAAFSRWRQLTVEQPAVRLEGVVTATMPSGAFRLHDGELGIYVTKSTGGRDVVPGDRVRVSGVLRNGGFSPWVTPTEVSRLGRGEFPRAKPASHELLASGAADNQWLEIEGVVRAFDVRAADGFVELELGMAQNRLRVLVNQTPDAEFASLIDAHVRMRGVAAVNVDGHGRVVEPSFRVPDRSHIEVIRAAPADPFAGARVPFGRLMRVFPGELHWHRVLTAGVVTRRLSDTTFFLRDGNLGLKVETREPVGYRPGDLVEVAGFPGAADGLPVLQYAIARSPGRGEPPQPAQPEVAALLDGTHTSNLVSVEARLVDWVISGRRLTLIFQAGDQLFKGLFTHAGDAPPALPEKNSLVRVSGISVISEVEDVWFYQPRSFVLLLADLGDLHVLHTPPWWTPQRLAWALGATGAVLLACVGWGWALRRQVERKRAVIEQQARHAAALEERSRIARELHDTLEQGLTGLSLQMKAMETDLAGSTHPVRERLHFARQMLRQSRALARNAIRELRSEAVPDRLDGLEEGLKRVANSWNHSGALRVNLSSTGAVRRLDARLEQHLLGIGTEAMTNAVKHGRASCVQIDLRYGPDFVVLQITDDGVGFDPTQQMESSSGCFGLLGMRERAREIRGELRIESAGGRGTEIMVTAPVPAEPSSPEPAASTAPGALVSRASPAST